MKLLNLGCGQKYHHDWINIDFVSTNEYVIEHNLLSGIPFADNAVNVVYHSHILEHFTKDDGLRFTEQCYRVLDTNGIIRIAVPDLEKIAQEYIKNLHLALEGNDQGKNDYEWIKLELFDQMVRNESGGDMKNYLYQPVLKNESYIYQRIGLEAKAIRNVFLNQETKSIQTKQKPQESSFLKLILRKVKRILLKSKSTQNNWTNEELKALRIGQFRLGGEIHQWMYDRYSLSELLRKVGFKEIRICSAFDSGIPNWETYQLDVINGEVRKPDSLFIEAKKT